MLSPTNTKTGTFPNDIGTTEIPLPHRSCGIRPADTGGGLRTIGRCMAKGDFDGRGTETSRWLRSFRLCEHQGAERGILRLSTAGTFDTLNPLLAKGEAATGLSLVFDTLMKSTEEELSASYGLLAEGVSYPNDISKATFRLRAEAKWADGKQVTPEDVVFSFEKAKDLSPQLATYYTHVTKAEVSGERDITFTFDEKNNRELPQIVGQLLIVPKHWWEAAGPDGKPRDISRGTLEPVMGSGPYKIASVSRLDNYL